MFLDCSAHGARGATRGEGHTDVLLIPVFLSLQSIYQSGYVEGETKSVPGVLRRSASGEPSTGLPVAIPQSTVNDEIHAHESFRLEPFPAQSIRSNQSAVVRVSFPLRRGSRRPSGIAVQID